MRSTTVRLVAAAVVACVGGFVLGQVVLGEPRPARADSFCDETWTLFDPTITRIQGPGDIEQEEALWNAEAWLYGEGPTMELDPVQDLEAEILNLERLP